MVSNDKRSILSSAKDSITTAARKGTLAFSDWLLDTTPFFLVSTYYIVTTAIFCLSNQEAIRVFYFFFMVCNTYVTTKSTITNLQLCRLPTSTSQPAAWSSRSSD